MIASQRQPAGRTQVPTIRQAFGYPLSTQACLACAARVHPDQLTPSIRSFVREKGKELRPSSIRNGLRQHSASKPFDVQIFDGNKPVLIDQGTRYVVVKVGPLCFNVSVLPSKDRDSFATAIRPLLSACYSPLRHTQPALRLFSQPGIVDFRTVTQGCKGRQAEVDADYLTGRGKRGRLTDHGKDHDPTSRLALDRNGLDLTFDRTVQLGLNLANTSCPILPQPAVSGISASASRNQPSIPWNCRS